MEKDSEALDIDKRPLIDVRSENAKRRCRMRMNEFVRNLVSKNASYILLCMLAKAPMHGYGLIKTIRKTFGVYLGPSTIYPTLASLERKELVDSQWDTTGVRPRKIYNITSEGRQLVTQQNVEFQRMLRVIATPLIETTT